VHFFRQKMQRCQLAGQYRTTSWIRQSRRQSIWCCSAAGWGLTSVIKLSRCLTSTDYTVCMQRESTLSYVNGCITLASEPHPYECIKVSWFDSCQTKTIVDHVLCLLWAVPSDVMTLMIQSYADYMRPENFRVSVGTWNVNGGKHFRSIAFKHEHITDWLIDLPKIIRSTAPGMLWLSVTL